ncbi:tRNA(Ile)-lysidine synthase [Novipirellula aureliae]|uniref:tRNA(Ile)-lysidine synthase n=1 Tax=Novipirellula aureliae TaxID=2527966 RepID=A0A5C6E9G0_9BACT|nr:tRNA lysidine(34) synthetase TilS [Novipirellula aureliae]TWU45390.1 tRNA(Ile)-lysidine synthase [Novipirellula aureliae]
MNIDQFLSEIATAWPVSRWTAVGVVVGCSGGADSVALLRGLCELRKQELERLERVESVPPSPGFIVAAHYNHALRGRDADADEALVRELAERLGIECVVETRSTQKGELSSDEESLRNERLAFLKRHAERLGARYVAVGHTANDNVETVLHHLFRGSGPAGLAGIAPHRSLGKDVVLIRPMLSIQRSDLRGVLESIGQSWREDLSNRCTDYRRNWIRHKLLPRILEAFPNAESAMARATESQRDWRDLVHQFAADWLDENVRLDHAIEVKVDRTTRSAIVIAAMQRLWKTQNWPLRDMTMLHWKRLYRTISGQSDKRYQLPGRIEVVCSLEYVSLRSKLHPILPLDV